MGDDVVSPTIGRRWVIRPSPQLFTPDFRPSHGRVKKTASQP